MCSSVTFKCKKAATPRISWIFRTKRGENFSKKRISCLFFWCFPTSMCFWCFSFGIFCKDIHFSSYVIVFHENLPTSLDHQFFVPLFAGEERHILLSWNAWKVNFHHQLTPLKFNILNLRIIQLKRTIIFHNMLLFKCVLLASSSSLCSSELVQTASDYPFTDLSMNITNHVADKLNVMYHK